jgi:hypothetical protein
VYDAAQVTTDRRHLASGPPRTCNRLLACSACRHDGLVIQKVAGYFQHRRQREKRWRLEVHNQHRGGVRALQALSDVDLIASAPGIPSRSHEMELQRRLKEAIALLTSETIKSRGSAERLTRWLIGFTIALVVLTLAVVALSAALLATG